MIFTSPSLHLVCAPSWRVSHAVPEKESIPGCLAWNADPCLTAPRGVEGMGRGVEGEAPLEKLERKKEREREGTRAGASGR